MPLPQIEFELPLSQLEILGYPPLRQGQPLSLVLDGGVLLPDTEAEFWYQVSSQRLPRQLVPLGLAIYAFSGTVTEAAIEYGQEQHAILAVDCGPATIRIACAPQADGTLPYGTWETRSMVGMVYLRGLPEDSFPGGIGPNTDVTISRFRRLVLTPGDPHFGEWHEEVALPGAPVDHHRIYVVARVHRTLAGGPTG